MGKAMDSNVPRDSDGWSDFYLLTVRVDTFFTSWMQDSVVQASGDEVGLSPSLG